MTTEAVIERIAHAGPSRALGPGVSNRMLVTPDDLRQQSPFILLVEDFIGPQGDFHEHPHRGLETVTFILSGMLEHGDHLGSHGVLQPGDVQWMTAGRGIIHGGKPADGSTVHGLQLWLNLPNALRKAPPGTRVQRRDTAIVERTHGAKAHTYGENGVPPWSRTPMTLTDIEIAAGGRYDLKLVPEHRTFVCVIDGEPRIGGTPYRSGDIVWPAIGKTEAHLPITSDGPARLVAYSGVPIDEAVFAGGPFVAGSEAELHRDFADLRSGDVVSR
jgi:hypothetical protein